MSSNRMGPRAAPYPRPDEPAFLDDGAVARLRALAATATEGEVLGDRFELIAPIGEGGMSVVWSAWDREAEREVAVKVIRDASEAAQARFAREVAALQGIDRVAVVKPIAHGTTADGAPFLVMDRLSGRTLAERLATGRLTLRETVALGRVVAGALAAVHAAGLVHRDVKPSNLFLVRGDPADVRLLDFGLARGRDGLRLTRTGALLGTPGYMAPEQVRGDPTIDPAADLFALGAVLFECIAGRAAFWAEDVERALTKILLETPPLLRTQRPATPLALEGLIESLLDKDPKRRPDANTVAGALTTLAATLDDIDEGASRPAVGTLIGGKYRVDGTLGEGGMGVILAATHVELDRPVALKLLRARGSGEDEARLHREARALSRLDGEHIARVLDVGRLDDGAPYVVIERLEGRDLARVLRDHGPLPIADAARFILEACEGIAEAHALGIVHRDLKPSNLFLTQRRDGSACLKVLDFGISKAPGTLLGDRSLTSPSAVMGSPWYMSPEQLASAKNVDARTDIWALGVVLHELVAGTPPFDAETAAGIGARIAAGEPPRLRDIRRDVPRALEDVVLRCLAKDPNARFQTVATLARALAPFAESSDASVDRIARMLGDAPAVAEAPPPPRRRSIPLAATLSLAAVALTAAVLFARSRAPATLATSATASAAAPAATTSISTASEPPPTTAPITTASVPAPITTASAPRPSAAPPAPRSSIPAAPHRPPAAQPSASAAPRPPRAAPTSIDVRDPALDGR
ncbi:serine/threonine protein kinase [Minicystis rosea]|nr:serine/threonine protein kinase [Minicystis rosea]